MKEQNLMKRSGATPGKLALVGVLAVILVAVIVGQLPEKTAAPELANKRPASHRKHNTQKPTPTLLKNIPGKSRFEKTNTSTNSKEQPLQKPTWPKLSLKTIVAFDPFAPPTWLTQARTAEQSGDPEGLYLSETSRQKRKDEVLEKLREQGTTIVVISAEEKRATIGEQSVRIGDRIEGFLITDITKQGVVLSEIE